MLAGDPRGRRHRRAPSPAPPPRRQPRYWLRVPRALVGLREGVVETGCSGAALGGEATQLTPASRLAQLRSLIAAHERGAARINDDSRGGRRRARRGALPPERTTKKQSQATGSFPQRGAMVDRDTRPAAWNTTSYPREYEIASPVRPLNLRMHATPARAAVRGGGGIITVAGRAAAQGASDRHIARPHAPRRRRASDEDGGAQAAVAAQCRRWQRWRGFIGATAVGRRPGRGVAMDSCATTNPSASPASVDL